MQIKLFTIPVLGGEALSEDLNLFLRSQKILQVEHQLVQNTGGYCWCFCIKYLGDQNKNDYEKQKKDYRQVLDKDSFQRFSLYREIRKRLALEEAIPAYAIFTDDEMAALSKLGELTETNMKSVKGISDKKVEKYSRHFINPASNEKA